MLNRHLYNYCSLWSIWSIRHGQKHYPHGSPKSKELMLVYVIPPCYVCHACCLITVGIHHNVCLQNLFGFTHFRIGLA